MKEQQIERRNEVDMLSSLGGENANPRRGAKYETMARAFIRKFPPESILDDQQLDDFITEWDSEYRPGRDRRSVMAHRLRAAGSHPRIPRGGDPSFTIQSDHAGRWLVRPCSAAISKGVVLEEFQQQVRAQQDKLRLLAEGVDLTQHSPGDVRYLKLEFEIQCFTFRTAMTYALDAVKKIEMAANSFQIARALPELDQGQSDG